MYKKFKIIVIAFCIVLFSSHSLRAGVDVVDFSLGCATSFLIHEAAHWIVGNITGELTFEPENGWPIAVYEGDKEGSFKTASAGFMAQLLLQEYYLRKRPEGDIWKGIFWYSVCSNLLYFYRFPDDGDLKAMSDASGISAGTFHTILTTLTALELVQQISDSALISAVVLM